MANKVMIMKETEAKDSIEYNKKDLELLAPAKNFMAIKASGPYADAIYFGVDSFNMRMKADNFKLSDLKKIVKICHKPSNPKDRIRKAYLTTNIVIYEEELQQLEKVLKAAKEAGIDAVIVHDIAAIKLAKDNQMDFHVSTQCNVTNSISAKHYEKLGAKRIIVARECNLSQIKQIANKLSTATVEAFVHGAMCSSISGRCYLSQTIACSEKQSANRGLCTQPCRGEWKLQGPNDTEFIYDGERIFNSRDLCMISHVPELIESGIKSFKIEGRMRHPHYVETVSRVYREAIDFHLNKIQKPKGKGWITQLKEVYNRGFTTGFYFNRASIKDSQLKNPANVSHFRYIEMGKILKFHQKSSVMKIQLINGTLSVGDELIVMSTKNSGDTYFHQKVDDLRIDGKEVKTTKRATSDHPITVNIRCAQKVCDNKIDSIFKFTDETYRNTNNRSKKHKTRKKNSYNLK
jgi:U32 family peptidase